MISKICAAFNPMLKNFFVQIHSLMSLNTRRNHQLKSKYVYLTYEDGKSSEQLEVVNPADDSEAEFSS